MGGDFGGHAKDHGPGPDRGDDLVCNFPSCHILALAYSSTVRGHPNQYSKQYRADIYWFVHVDTTDDPYTVTLLDIKVDAFKRPKLFISGATL